MKKNTQFTRNTRKLLKQSKSEELGNKTRKSYQKFCALHLRASAILFWFTMIANPRSKFVIKKSFQRYFAALKARKKAQREEKEELQTTYVGRLLRPGCGGLYLGK